MEKKSKSVSKCDEKLCDYSQFVWAQVGDKNLGKKDFLKIFNFERPHNYHRG